MNKASKLFAGCAALALIACSSDELPVDGPQMPEDNTPVFNGESAFLTVSLRNVGDFNGKSTTDGGYSKGSASEHKIENAFFYFYNENGVFVAKGDAWSGGSDQDNVYPGPVEFQGNTTLVLENVKQKGYPSYMLTVINVPGDTAVFNSKIREAVTIQAAGKILTDEFANVNNGGFLNTKGTDDDKDDLFIMTSSSYQRTGEGSQFYFATPIPAGAFKEEPSTPVDASDIVEIYVERLAAKATVTVKMDSSKNPEHATIPGLYELETTLAGGDNDNVGGNGLDIAASKVYVKFIGWGLQNTNKKSKLAKDLDDLSAINGWAWNDASNFRSYWGKSYGWNTAVDFNRVRFGEIVAAQAGVAINADAYCAENTNPATFLGRSDNADLVDVEKVTSVALAAQVCDSKGNPISLVEYRGVPYLYGSYMQFVLNDMNTATPDKLNFYYVVDSETTTTETTTPDGIVTTTKTVNKYEQIKSTMFTITEEGTGDNRQIFVTFDEEAFKKIQSELPTASNIPADVMGKLYAKNGKNEDGTDKFEPADVATLNANLKAFNTAANREINVYTDGYMYYTIPVEHLNSTIANAGVLVDGKYGMVRNHYYNIEINSIGKLGTGVFNPGTGEDGDYGEELKPGNPDDPTYYVAARINVLSWKIVKQGVDL